MVRKSGSIDMTQGSPLKLMLMFALPLFAGNALQQFYNMVDSMVVGRFVGSTALAAVGVAFPVMFLVSSLFTGIGMGATVMVSQYRGANNPDSVRKTVDTIYTSLIVGGVPLSLLGVLLTGPLLDLVSVPPNARDEAYLYLVILLAGLLGGLGFNFNAGILQGIGDSRSPLLFLLISTVMNVVLDLALVLIVHMDVAGVAVATVVAQWFSWIFGILYINKKYPQLRIRPFSFKFDRVIFSRIIRQGLPAGIQNALVGFSILMLSRLVNTFGSDFSAGFAAANKLDTFVFLPISSVYTALITFTGQNMGRGDTARVRRGARTGIALCFALSLMGLLVIPAGPALISLFNTEPAVIESGMALIYRIMPAYCVLSVLYSLNGVIRGAGDPVIPMISTAVGLWLARVPAAYLLADWFGRDNMFFCYACGWFMSMFIVIPAYASGRWKNKAVTRAGSNIGGDT